MNIVNFKIAKFYIKNLLKKTIYIISIVGKIRLFIGVLILCPSARAWDVDFSRRTEFSQVTDLNRLPRNSTNRSLASEDRSESSTPLLQRVFEPSLGISDVVIIISDSGFIPSTIRLKKGESYKFHIVNVSTREKNASLIMDAFSERHNAVFGKLKEFSFVPRVDGLFSYQCPELGWQGELVILNSDKKSGI